MFASQNQVWRVVSLVIVVSIVIVAAVAIRANLEFQSDRERISAKCDALVLRLKNTPSDEAALRELTRILNSNWSFARVRAAVSLGQVGSTAMPSFSELERAAVSSDEFLKREAIIAIGKVSANSEAGVRILEKKLQEDWVTATFAAEGLGEIGAPARRSIPALKARADIADDPTVVRAANLAIERIQSTVPRSNIPTD